MLNFDSNKWYQITVKESKYLSLASSALYDHGYGTIFFKITNTSEINQQWQIYTANTGSYPFVLRSREGGPKGYITAAVGGHSTGDNTGETVPHLSNYTLSDDSMYWQITPWGDGTYYLTNKANGTQWHLNVLRSALMTMSSNITGNQVGQRYSWNEGNAINDKRYSTLLTATASPTSIPSSATSLPVSAAPTSQVSQAPNSSNASSGLSTGAKAGIGAGVGIVALIALILLAFFLLRRRRRRSPVSSDPVFYEQVKPAEMSTDPSRIEMEAPPPPDKSNAPMWVSSTNKPRVEMEVPPAELPAAVPEATENPRE